MTFCLNACVEHRHKNCTAVFAQNESRFLASPHLHIEYCVSFFNDYQFNARASKKKEEKIIPSCYNHDYIHVAIIILSPFSVLCSHAIGVLEEERRSVGNAVAKDM